MRTSPPALIPLFRSDGQARILAILFDRSRAPLSIGQIANLSRCPIPTASREVQRLARHGMVTITKVGRTQLVTANWTLPWADTLAQLVAQTVGLPAVIGRALRDVPGVEAALIFGSWAARHEGRGDRPPNDIDLLVIGDVSLDDLRDPLRPAEELAGLYINPTIISRRRWAAADDPFVSTIRERPLVEVPLGSGNGERPPGSIG